MPYYAKSIFKKCPKYLAKMCNIQIEESALENNLKNKIESQIPIKNKMAAMQLNTIILPAVATYETLLSMGCTTEECHDCIRQYVLFYYKSQAAIINCCGRLPFFRQIFKYFFSLAMKMYPTEFWNIEWVENTKDKIAFNMHDCLYFKTLKEFGCEELTSIFCAVDNLFYDNMSKHVKFIRTQTLGNQGKLCDFKFICKK